MTGLAQAVAAAVPDARVDDAGGLPQVTVPVGAWRDAAAAARAAGADFFDWLSGVDAGAGATEVVVHLWSTLAREHLLLRAVLAPGEVLGSLVGLYPGADWHERETAEMFGVDLDGRSEPEPLLLPAGFAGHPLRKDFALAERGARRWPGFDDPSGAAGRRVTPPVGLPEDRLEQA